MSPERHRAARWNRIVERYRRGDLVTQIAEDEGVSVKTVRNAVHRAGVPLRNPRQPDRNARIIERYQAGERVGRIASDESVVSSYVSGLARKSGLPAREDWRRKYPIDHEAFANPSPIGWWLVGLLAADGSINSARHQISLSQRATDADVLTAFYEYVGSAGRPLVELRWANRPEMCADDMRYFEARVHSKQLCADLAAYGVVPRKSATLKLSREAAAQPGVWLGLLDGDGFVSETANHGRPRLDFYGAEPVMRQCSEFWGGWLDLATGRPPSLNQHSGSEQLFKVSIHGANAIAAARMLVDASPKSLERKRRTLLALAKT